MRLRITYILTLVILATCASAHAQSGADEIGAISDGFDFVPTAAQRIVQLKAERSAIEAMDDLEGEEKIRRVLDRYHEIEHELAKLEGRPAQFDVANGDGTVTTVVILQPKRKESEEGLRKQHAAKVAQMLFHSLKGAVHSCIGLNGYADESRQAVGELESDLKVLKARIRAVMVKPTKH